MNKSLKEQLDIVATEAFVKPSPANSLLEAKAAEPTKGPMEKEVEVTQNTVEETPLTDSSTVENAPAADSTQQPGTQNNGAAEGETKPPSWENAYGELRRKVEEMPTVIQQAVQQVLASQQQNRPTHTQPQVSSEEAKYKGYTKGQLESIISHPEATEQDRLFANRGLGVLEAKEEAAKEFDARHQKVQTQTRQQSALGELIRDYPQVYIKETNSWNTQDPLFQRGMAIFNSDPRFQQLGNEGLQVAMDRAFAQMTREGSLNLKKKEVAVNAKERQTQKLQSQALQSGTQSAPQKETGTGAKIQKLMADYAKSQDPRLFQEIVKLKGLLPQGL